MNNFEKIYIDGVPTEKAIDVELAYRDMSMYPDLLDESTKIGKKYKIAKEVCQDVVTINLRDKIDEPKNNSGRAIKKSAKRSNKV